jgi:hypothetical protein
MKTLQGQCDACQVLMINGRRCHETGCLEAWRDHKRECKWCGSEFVPEDRHQQFDDESCAESYNG